MKQSILSLLVLMACLVVSLSGHADDSTTPTVEVTTAALVKADLVQTVQAYGTIDTAPNQSMAISLPYAGQVSKLLVTAGKRVRRGDVLLEFTPDPSVTLAFRQAQTALTLAQGDVARTRRMIAEHLATNAQLAIAEKALADAEAAVQSQQEAGGGQTSVLVHAPLAGTVIGVASAKGDRIAAGTTMMNIASPLLTVATLGMEPGESRLVRRGQTASLHDLDEALDLTGVVENIGDAVEPKSGLVICTISITGSATAPLAGEHLSGKITVAQQQSWAVPRGAVISDSQGTYIFQIADGKAKRVTVKTGLESDGLIGIDGDVAATLPVIVQGSYEAADGMAARIAEPNGPDTTQPENTK